MGGAPRGSLITVSSGLRQRLIELGISPGRVRVLRNGVDLARFGPCDREAARQALGLTRPTLLAVGNLVPLKRHKLMPHRSRQTCSFFWRRSAS